MFDNVNVSNLDMAISSCKNNLKYNNATEVLNGINSDSVWQSSAKTKIVDALNDLIDNKYKNLVSELDNCSTLKDLISNYKSLEETNKSLNSDIIKLEADIAVEREKISVDNLPKIRIKIDFLEKQISSLQQTINDNKTQMESIKNNIINITG